MSSASVLIVTGPFRLSFVRIENWFVRTYIALADGSGALDVLQHYFDRHKIRIEQSG